MQREIKFRGFNEAEKKWVEGNLLQSEKWGISDNCVCEIHVPFASEPSIGIYPVVQDSVGQFTGLKDKNGKEIYEGDIIEMSLREKKGYQYRFKVSFIDGAFMLEGKDLKSFGLRPFASLYQKDSEVIGNIYENKELAQCQ